MKNTKDFHKIKSGEYGAINFNKMLPVGDNELLEINIDNESDIAYKKLLQNQYLELVNIKDVILRKSRSIYELFISNEALSLNDLKVKERCCDFLLLERKMIMYTMHSQAEDEAAIDKEH